MTTNVAKNEEAGKWVIAYLREHFNLDLGDDLKAGESTTLQLKTAEIVQLLDAYKKEFGKDMPLTLREHDPRT